jgi:hypothetical protein
MLALWRAVRSDVPDEVLASFRSSGALSVGEAIAVYKDGYWSRQYEVLCELFPRIHEQLGGAEFRELVRRYLRACPSVHPELERLGDALPWFLRAQDDRTLSALASTAIYEHALIDSLLAADSPIAALSEIRADTFGSARLELVASLRIVPIDRELRRVLAAERGNAVVGAHAAVIVRPRFAIHVHFVNRDELRVLDLVRAGATVGELLLACDHDLSHLHALLARWFHRRWIAAIHEESIPDDP